MTSPDKHARRRWTLWAALVPVGLGLAAVTSASWAAQGDEWNYAGGPRENTRHQRAENKISPANAASLVTRWVFTTQGDVSATPSTDATTVYAPDWAGHLWALDKKTGALKWSVYLPSLTGLPGDKARATPAVTADKVIVGTQGPFGGGGKVLAFNKFTGALVWATQADSHPAAIITQSATVHDGRVYVGVASQEEAFASLIPDYPCCSFRGSLLALDLATGAILWKTYLAPVGYSGNALWGSSPAIDVKRRQVYVATGNNYSVPQSVLNCVAAAGSDPVAKAACLPADNHFDSVMALDLQTGAIRWATRALPYDAWTTDCIPFFGDGSNCPQPAGPDFDFGQAPALFTVTTGQARPRELVGAGQKSGQYWALEPDTGAVVWVTQAGPGGTAGGLQWGSAVDGRRVYVANANSNGIPWTPLGGASTTHGGWSGLDAATGQILWQRADPNPAGGLAGGGPSGPVSVANGVVFGCSLDAQGHMYALHANTGAMLWRFASGGSCLSGAAISDGMLYWGSGYSNFGGFFGTPNNKLFAFGLP